MKFLSKRLTFILPAIAIFAIALAGVTPALAQEGQQTTYTTVEGDTLGDLLGQAGVTVDGFGIGTDANELAVAREFFSLNSGLTFAAEPAVEVPEGVETVGEVPVAGTPVTLGSFGTTYGLEDDTAFRQFVAENEDLVVTAGQTVQIPAAAAGAGTDQGQTGTGTGTTGTGTDQSQAGTYTVQAGESLADIAARYGVTVDQLLELNPNLVAAGTTINVPAEQGAVPQTGQGTGQQSGQGTGQQSDQGTGQGQQSGQGTGSFFINLPEDEVTGEGVQQRPNVVSLFEKPENVGGGLMSYQVQSGESVESIASEFGTTAENIRLLNPQLHNQAYLLSGQWIVVPSNQG